MVAPATVNISGHWVSTVAFALSQTAIRENNDSRDIFRKYEEQILRLINTTIISRGSDKDRIDNICLHNNPFILHH